MNAKKQRFPKSSWITWQISPHLRQMDPQLTNFSIFVMWKEKRRFLTPYPDAPRESRLQEVKPPGCYRINHFGVLKNLLADGHLQVNDEVVYWNFQWTRASWVEMIFAHLRGRWCCKLSPLGDRLERTLQIGCGGLSGKWLTTPSLIVDHEHTRNIQNLSSVTSLQHVISMLECGQDTISNKSFIAVCGMWTPNYISKFLGSRRTFEWGMWRLRRH